jgi:hypothetical protein
MADVYGRSSQIQSQDLLKINLGSLSSGAASYTSNAVTSPLKNSLTTMFGSVAPGQQPAVSQNANYSVNVDVSSKMRTGERNVSDGQALKADINQANQDVNKVAGNIERDVKSVKGAILEGAQRNAAANGDNINPALAKLADNSGSGLLQLASVVFEAVLPGASLIAASIQIPKSIQADSSKAESYIKERFNSLNDDTKMKIQQFMGSNVTTADGRPTLTADKFMEFLRTPANRLPIMEKVNRARNNLNVAEDSVTQAEKNQKPTDDKVAAAKKNPEKLKKYMDAEEANALLDGASLSEVEEVVAETVQYRIDRADVDLAMASIADMRLSNLDRLSEEDFQNVQQIRQAIKEQLERNLPQYRPTNQPGMMGMG